MKQVLLIITAVIIALTVPSCNTLNSDKAAQIATAAKTAVTVYEQNGKLSADEAAAIRAALDAVVQGQTGDTKQIVFNAANTAITFAESTNRITPEQALLIRTALTLLE